MHKRERDYILLAVFIILGIVVALQVKSTLNAKKISTYDTLNVDRLVSRITDEQKEIDQLNLAISESLKKRDILIKEYLEKNMDNESSEEWKKTMLKAGFTDVKGSGIIIKLDDASVRQENMELRDLIIHDQDIRVLLNELKKAGAQAIAVNGERVTAISEQVCAGPTILINGNRYAVPYIIEAIGNPEILYGNIINCPRIAEMIEFKIRIEINKSKELMIPQYSGITRIDTLISGLEELVK